MNRVQGILDAVKRFYPEFDVPLPPKKRYGMAIGLVPRMGFPISDG